MVADLPYRLACLCDLRDAEGRILLIRRTRSPNQGLVSPIGGKLDVVSGESPAQCARREIQEEAGLDIPIDRLRLIGLVSEQAYEGRGHWLLFFFRVLGPVSLEPRDISEGRLEWFRPDELDALPLPETDRKVIWPLVRAHEPEGSASGVFTVHIDCRRQPMTWDVEQHGGRPATGPPSQPGGRVDL